jgi:hypothetical protein
MSYHSDGTFKCKWCNLYCHTPESLNKHELRCYNNPTRKHLRVSKCNGRYKQ